MGFDDRKEQLIKDLYSEMYTLLYRYAKKHLNDASLAEEAVQDVFRIACVKIDALASSENPNGWLINTLKYVLLNIKRHQARTKMLIVTSVTIEELNLKDDKSDSQIAVDFEITYQKLLGNEDYKLLELVVLKQYTIAEAAKALGISIEACKKRVQRAKKKLRKIINTNFD